MNSSFTISIVENNLSKNETGAVLQGPVLHIVVVGILFLFQVTTFVCVTRMAWNGYLKTKKVLKGNYLEFLKELSPLKKCFLVSNICILLDSGIFLTRICLPIYYNDYVCTICLRIMGPTTYSIGLTSVYIYLWARQYLLHSSPVLRSSLPRWLPILSKFSLVLTIASFIMQLLSVWADDTIVRAIFRHNACYHGASAAKYFPFVTMGATIFTQTIYLILFWATLNIHSTLNQVARNSESNHLGTLIKRCGLLAFVSIFTDLCGSTLLIFFVHKTPEINLHMYPKINMTINLICMITCFNNFPAIWAMFLNIITFGKRQLPNSSVRQVEPSTMSTVSVNGKSIPPETPSTTLTKASINPKEVSDARV